MTDSSRQKRRIVTSMTHTMVFEFEYVYVANLFEDVGHLHFMDKKTFSAY